MFHCIASYNLWTQEDPDTTDMMRTAYHGYLISYPSYDSFVRDANADCTPIQDMSMSGSSLKGRVYSQ